MLGWALLGLSALRAHGDPRSAYLAPEGLEATLAEELARAGVRIAAWHGRLALSPDPPVRGGLGARHLDRAARDRRPLGEGRRRRAAGDSAQLGRLCRRPPPAHGADRRPPAAGEGRHAALSRAGAGRASRRLDAAGARLSCWPARPRPAPSSTANAASRRTAPARPAAPTSSCGRPARCIGAWPRPGERCIDLGAAPGGWTWAIARLGAAGARRGPRRARPARGRHAGRDDAAGERLRARRPSRRTGCSATSSPIPTGCLRWCSAGSPPGAARRIVCTLKFQGATDHAAAAAFAAIPGGRVMHLFHNKHELTFVWRG